VDAATRFVPEESKAAGFTSVVSREDGKLVTTLIPPSIGQAREGRFELAHSAVACDLSIAPDDSRPDNEQQAEAINAAARLALRYVRGLPDFLCTEVISGCKSKASSAVRWSSFFNRTPHRSVSIATRLSAATRSRFTGSKCLWKNPFSAWASARSATRPKRVGLPRFRPPPMFPLIGARNLLDYDHTAVGGAQYQLPVRAETLIDSNTGSSHNVVEFRDYRKFSADALPGPVLPARLASRSANPVRRVPSQPW